MKEITLIIKDDVEEFVDWLSSAVPASRNFQVDKQCSIFLEPSSSGSPRLKKLANGFRWKLRGHYDYSYGYQLKSTDKTGSYDFVVFTIFPLDDDQIKILAIGNEAPPILDYFKGLLSEIVQRWPEALESEFAKNKSSWFSSSDLVSNADHMLQEVAERYRSTLSIALQVAKEPTIVRQNVAGQPMYLFASGKWPGDFATLWASVAAVGRKYIKTGFDEDRFCFLPMSNPNFDEARSESWMIAHHKLEHGSDKFRGLVKTDRHSQVLPYAEVIAREIPGGLKVELLHNGSCRIAIEEYLQRLLEALVEDGLNQLPSRANTQTTIVNGDVMYFNQSGGVNLTSSGNINTNNIVGRDNIDSSNRNKPTQ